MPQHPLDEDDVVLDWRVQGLAAEQVAELSVELGKPPTATIKALKKRYGLSIGQAKQLVDGFIDAPRRYATEYLRVQAELAGRLPASATDDDVRELVDEAGWNLKLWGLVEAGRGNEALSALEHFDPAHMRFQGIGFEDARRLVENEIDTWPVPMSIADREPSEHSFGWSFSCQSDAYLASGDMLDQVMGHGPFLVDRWIGVLWATGSAFPLDRCVANYLSTGNPGGRRAPIA